MIWFDFGGVLSPPIPALFQQYQQKTGLAPAQLQQAMRDVAAQMALPMLAPVENAVISEAEWGRRLENALRMRHPEIDLSRARLREFGAQWFAGVSPNRTMLQAVRQLKAAGYQVGILTNNVLEWEPHWRAMLQLDSVVELVVDSCKEGCRKPDARFFAIAAQRAAVQPADCLLIDDVQENIEAAASLGWHTLWFQDNAQTLLELENITRVALREHMELAAI
ncbi:HAD-superfamily hydrolase subfamily IA, variant 3 [Aquitalea magnusonii]|jgi:putative hydrolase of the HAD superfamily|uniref:HAD-superfamily hydrolase subfamily IA, variant 3 n=2 Tax=Aquitalea magnusonii TaxID=332411 RepID=A0A3G9GAP1_9NEIS|nr:HAD-superfamily hydrolase subfamily IA, variant 3 [Aquitalea magnusonii]